MEKDHSYSDQPMAPPPSLGGFQQQQQDYNLPQSSHRHLHLHHPQHQCIKSRIMETSAENGDAALTYFLNTPQQYPPPLQQIDKLSFADVMQFADFGPKLSLYGQTNKLPADQDDENDESGGIDPVYFLKFPVLNDRSDQQDRTAAMEGELNEVGAAEDGEGRVSEHSPVEIRRFLGEDDENKCGNNNNNNNGNGNGNNNGSWLEGKNKRKRARAVKTSEEVESQRMTHIAVERNRRKQMNEHLRVLRSLMPGSYVQRGDQASIIGGAIEFVRELEQLLQCLESQKRRRLLGEPPIQPTDSQQLPPPPQPPFIPAGAVLPHPNDNQMKMMDFETSGLIREETAESKSCLADVEVKLVGFDAMIKILSRRRPGQLIKAIAALEDLQLNILHTNITTIEQTVLYSFNVKVASESRFTAEDIAGSVQQIFGFIHANSGM